MLTARMVRTERADPVHVGPVYNISSLFAARRDLRPTAKLLIQGSGLSVEESDLLVLLYGFSKLGWDDCAVEADG